MPAGTDLIFFERPEDWQVIANVTRRAEIINENSHTPIPAFDLGVTLDTDYIAIVATTSQKKPTWNLAGDIAQVYSFAPGGSNSLLSNIQPVRNRIWIDKLQLIETNRVSTDNFRLRFTPVSWFVDVAVRVYKYTGDTLNFVEDALFDIGNALGVDPNGEPSIIANQLDVLEELITDKFTELKKSREAEQQLEDLRENELRTQVNQIDAGIYTVVDAIADLLPSDRAAEVRQNAQTRLNLDLGFL